MTESYMDLCTGQSVGEQGLGDGREIEWKLKPSLLEAVDISCLE